VDPAEHLDAIRDESAALIAAAETAGLAAGVPACPGWTVADLLGHIGRVQRWQADMVGRGVTEPEWNLPDPPADQEVLTGWVAEASSLLVATLRATPPDTPMWTFSGPGDASFWFRRAAHETTMHRVDAEQAAGIPATVGAALACDGIDEHLESFVLGRIRGRFVGEGETVHLHCTDADGEWLVRLTPDGAEVERAHAKGDVAARGAAADLLLVLRRRRAPEAVEVFGDAELFGRFLDMARI
jgi:uncharacterized protein (TIGR03083 family)